MTTKVKVKETTKVFNDPELTDIFNQMMGNGDINPLIITPKYDAIMGHVNRILKVLHSFTVSPVAKVMVDEASSFKEISMFVEFAKEEISLYTLRELDKKVCTPEELKKINSDSKLLSEFLSRPQYKYDVKELGETYKKLKNSKTVKEMVMICKNLKPYAKYIEKKDSSCFMKHDSYELMLFNFSKLNFKYLYTSDEFAESPDLAKYTNTIINIIYTESSHIVKLLLSPDIDIEKFVSVLINNIDNIRKHVPRCDRAFDRILESVNLLRTNFDSYYKDFVSSQNPSIIIENFISDVAKNVKADVGLAGEFRRIVQFYHKHTEGKIKDERILNLFSMVNANIDALEKDEKKETKKGKKDEKEETKKGKKDEKEETKKGKKEVKKDEKPAKGDEAEVKKDKGD